MQRQRTVEILVAVFVAVFAVSCATSGTDTVEKDAAVPSDMAPEPDYWPVPDWFSPSDQPAASPDSAVPVSDTAPPSWLSQLPPYDKVGTRWAYSFLTRGQQLIYKAEVEKQVPLSGAAGPGFVHRHTYAVQPTTIQHLYTVQAGKLLLVKSEGNYRMITASTTYSPPLQILQAPLKKGDNWTQQVMVTTDTAGPLTRKVEVLGQESVTVAAGTFSCVKLRVTDQGHFNSVIHEWWSDKVGLVKSTAYANFELMSFKGAP